MRGMLFDKDGTLFDFNASWGRWAAPVVAHLAAGSATRAEALAEVMLYDREGQTFRPGSPVIANTLDETAALLAPHVDMSLAELTAYLDDTSTDAHMVPATDLAALLSDLTARDILLGVATNDSERAAHAHLAAAGISGSFGFVAGCDSGHGFKPAPGQLLAFAERTGLAPGEIAMVGDSTHDLGAGRTAGMVTIGVLTGPATRDDLAELADVVLPDIGHIPAWLDSRG